MALLFIFTIIIFPAGGPTIWLIYLCDTLWRQDLYVHHTFLGFCELMRRTPNIMYGIKLSCTVLSSTVLVVAQGSIASDCDGDTRFYNNTVTHTTIIREIMLM